MTDSGTLKNLNDTSILSGSYFRVAGVFEVLEKVLTTGGEHLQLKAPNASKFATLMRNCLAKTILSPRNWSHCEWEGLGIRSCPKLRVFSPGGSLRWYFGKFVENQNL